MVGNLRLLFIFYVEVQFSVLKASFTYSCTIMIISAVWHYDISGFFLNRHFKTKMIELLIEKLTQNRHSYFFFILFTSKGHNSQIFTSHCEQTISQSSLYAPLVYVYLCCSRHPSGTNQLPPNKGATIG